MKHATPSTFRTRTPDRIASQEEGISANLSMTGELIPLSKENQSAAGEVDVRVIRTIPDIQTIQDIWVRWQRHPNCDFDFYQRVVQSTPEIERPHILVCYRAGTADAMLVGRLDRSRVNLTVGYRTVLGFKAPTLTFLHGGFVGNKTAKNAAALLRSITKSLADGESEAAFFNHLRTNEPLYQAIADLPTPSWQKSLGSIRTHRGMTLPTTGERFTKTLNSKERNNQKRRSKRLNDDFSQSARITTFGSPSDLEAMIRDVDAIAKRTYQRTLGVGFEDTPSLRQRLQVEAEQGWLRAYVLYLDDRPCAFWMGNAYAGTFYSGFTGYDPEYSRYAPGMYLLLKAMEQLCDGNLNEVLKRADFGLGDAEWKQIIGNLEWPESAVYLFSPRWRGRLLGRTHAGSTFLDSLAKRVLRKTRLLARVKRVWRKRLGERAT
jgi:Acetyltransferase (GNAT) domain